MDLAEITTMLGTFAGIITPLGGVGAFLYRRQSKRLKEAEAKLAEVNVSKARMEVKANELKMYEDMNNHLMESNEKLLKRIDNLVQANAEKDDRHQGDIKDWEDRFKDQTNVLRSTNREYNQYVRESGEREKEYIKRNEELERKCDYLEMWQCHREHSSVACEPDEGCDRRKPQQPIPLKFVPTALIKQSNK